MKEKRVIVHVLEGLYYVLEVEKLEAGNWVSDRKSGLMVHENLLGDQIAEILRGPVFFKKVAAGE